MARATVYGKPDEPGHVVRAVCETEPFQIQGDYLDFYYGGLYPVENHTKMRALLVNANGEVIAKARGVPVDGNGWWRQHRAFVGNVAPGSTVQMKLTIRGTNFNEFSVRSRADLYRQVRWLAPIHNFFKPERARGVLCALVGFVLVWQLLYLSRRPNPSQLQIGLLIVLGALFVQFRVDPMFHADEWFFVWRLHEQGLRAVLLTHNEHLIPVFSLFYYLEYLIFGGHYELYVLVSALINAGSALLIAKLVRTLAGDRLARGAEWFIALLFAVSALHTESVQWGLSQSSILATFFALASMLSMLRYMQSGERKFAIAMAASVLCALFSFAIGFLLFGFLPLIWLFVWFFDREKFGRGSLKTVSVSLAAAMLIGVVFYKTFREGFKHGEVNKTTLPPWEQIYDFTALGSQFGTVLRGTSLFPFPDMHRFYPLLENSLAVFKAFRVELANIGIGVSVLFLLIGFVLPLRKDRWWRAALWLVASLWIILPMFAVALGRAQISDDYSISLRYHEFPSIGLMFLMLPVISWLWMKSTTGRNILAQSLCALVLIYFVGGQVHVGMDCEHFAPSGRSMREFIDQLRDWGEEGGAGVLRSGPPSVTMRPLLYSPFHKALVDHELPLERVADVLGFKLAKPD